MNANERKMAEKSIGVSVASMRKHMIVIANLRHGESERTRSCDAIEHDARARTQQKILYIFQ